MEWKTGTDANTVHRTSNERWKIWVREHNETFTEHEREQANKTFTVQRTSNTTFTFRVEQNIEQNNEHRTKRSTRELGELSKLRQISIRSANATANKTQCANKTANTTTGLRTKQRTQQGRKVEQNKMRTEQHANTTANTTAGCEHNKPRVEQNREHQTVLFEQRTPLETSPVHMFTGSTKLIKYHDNTYDAG